MSRYLTVLASFGLLLPLLLAAGAIVCSENETRLKEMTNTMTQLTDCLINCTMMTYLKKLQLRDKHNIRFDDSTEADPGEYCWSTQPKCTIGESFQRAYVVLPVDRSAVGHEMLEVKTAAPTTATSTTTTTTLHAHNSHIAIPENCGLRYDVTQHFSRESAPTSFCVQVVADEDVLGDSVLKCPPYLVTLWKRNRNQSKQEGGG